MILTVTHVACSDGEVHVGLITVTPAVALVQGGAWVPTDIDGDGRCDDANGNGRIDFADVVWLINRL